MTFCRGATQPHRGGVGWGVTTLIEAAPTGVHLVGGGAGPVGRGINPRGHEHMEFLAAAAKHFTLIRFLGAWIIKPFFRVAINSVA